MKSDTSLWKKIRESGWLLLSVLLHLLFLWFLILAPLPEEEAARPDPAEHLDRERLKEAAEKLAEINEPELDTYLAELEEIREAMTQIHEQRMEDLESFMADKPQQALRELIPLVASIVERQKIQQETFRQIAAKSDSVFTKWRETLTLDTHWGVVDQGYPELQSEIDQLARVQETWKASGKPISQLLSDQQRALDLMAWAGLTALEAEQREASVEQQKPRYDNWIWHEYDYQTRRLWDKVDKAYSRIQTIRDKDKYNSAIKDGRNAYAEILRRYGKIETNLQSAAKSQAGSLEREIRILEQLMALNPEEALPDQVPDEMKEMADLRPDAALDEKMEHADDLENEIRRMHEEISAAELSRRANVPFSQALESSRTNTPSGSETKPSDPPAPLPSEVATGKEFNDYKKALDDALRETRQKVDEASDRLAHASELNREAVSGVDIAAAFEASREQAKGEEKGVVSDLTRPPNGSSSGSSSHGNSQWPTFLTHHAGDGKGGEAFDAVMGFGLATLGPESEPWLGLNRWYIIGPFDTANGSQADRVFPPEHRVDLDAKYAGAEGRVLEWRYVHAPGTVVGVPDLRTYSVYYAYTEIRMEETRELWIAAASDDSGQMWIDGKLVWVGTYNPKDIPWSFENSLKMKGNRPAYFNHKGFRKLRLEKGIHRILFKVENTVGGCAFSVYLRNGDA
ncbi:MAG: hypothetical protein WD708_09225 [Kiritimatiellia bacterium]